ncbi:MAG: LytTR family transcriptional regulator [Bacteroidia bacterium]|nr:LytTR family transcriptional regulator [Bacteroidia bacterium]
MRLPIIRLKTNSGHDFVRFTDIIRLQASGSYTNFYFVNKKEPLLQSHRIGFYEQELSKESFFCRIHESHIVNVNYIDKDEGSNLILKDGTVLPISRKGGRNLNLIFSNGHPSASEQNMSLVK